MSNIQSDSRSASGVPSEDLSDDPSEGESSVASVVVTENPDGSLIFGWPTLETEYAKAELAKIRTAFGSVEARRPSGLRDWVERVIHLLHDLDYYTKPIVARDIPDSKLRAIQLEQQADTIKLLTWEMHNIPGVSDGIRS
jgi:hypothetical protein